MKLNLANSRRLYAEAVQLLPGGASSNLRVYPFYKPHPIFLERGKGSNVYDIDGNEYTDYLNAFGALILGHSHPRVTAAVRAQLEKGTMFGTAHELEAKVARKIRSMVPNVESVRFCNSGTEATMSALRLARAYAGKSKIVKFEGHYHGHHDSVCVSYQPPPHAWGSRLNANRIPITPGIPEETLSSVIPIPWNDLELFAKIVRRHGHEIAAVITEPLMGNGGMVFPREGYLEGLREITLENEIVLIFDEVFSGFRIAKGGASEYFGVKPDLHTFAKAIANGYPIAVFGGRKDIMDLLKPDGVLHAGTYAGNPLGLAAADATLSELDANGNHQYKQLYSNGTRLVEGLRNVAERAGQQLYIPGFAGYFVMLFTNRTDLKEWRDVAQVVDTERFEKFVWKMYEQGIYLHPDALERINLSMAHTKEDIDKTLVAAEKAFKSIKAESR